MIKLCDQKKKKMLHAIFQLCFWAPEQQLKVCKLQSLSLSFFAQVLNI